MNSKVLYRNYPGEDRSVVCFCDRKYRDRKPTREFTEDFLSLFLEKNSDGTKNLRLKGNELQYRIGKRICNDDIMLITSFAKKYPTLVKLDLSYNRIDNLGIAYLCEGLFRTPNNLEILVLIGCDIGCDPGGVYGLVKHIRTTKMRVLNLTGNKIGDGCSACFHALLMECKTLEKLDIGATHQTIKSIPPLLNALGRNNNETLKSLDLSDIIPTSLFNQPQPDVIADHLIVLFVENHTLKELHLQKCGLDGHSIESMIIGLRQNTSLLFLDLGFNKIGCFGAEKLAEWFKSSPALMGINLAGNSIGTIGGRALSFGIPYSKLRLLDLSKNRIKDKPLSEIVLSIKNVHPIRLFYIFGNEIGPLTMEVLERQIMAGVYDLENIDFKLFYTREGLNVAEYTRNNYREEIYNLLKPFEVNELRIKFNQLPGYYCRQRVKRDFDNFKLDKSPCDQDPFYEPPPFDQEKLERICAERGRLVPGSRETSEIQIAPIKEKDSDSCLKSEESTEARSSISHDIEFTSAVSNTLLNAAHTSFSKFESKVSMIEMKKARSVDLSETMFPHSTLQMIAQRMGLKFDSKLSVQKSTSVKSKSSSSDYI